MEYLKKLGLILMCGILVMGVTLILIVLAVFLITLSPIVAIFGAREGLSLTYGEHKVNICKCDFGGDNV